MKSLKIIFLLVFCVISAQKILPFDTLKLKETKDFFADDYGNIYLYKNKDFSFTKYDSLGKQLGKMMLTVPFKIQNVQNPLNIVLFSENAQEMKIVDQNLNEIQQIDLKNFGFIKMAYAEDLQQIWLLDESMKRLVQYNFRDDNILNSYPLDFDFEKIIDFLIYENKIYILEESRFFVFNFKSEKLYEKPLEMGRKLRRENNEVFIISENSISQFIIPNLYKTTFNVGNSVIVDKNSTSYFELKGNKLYLYEIEK